MDLSHSPRRTTAVLQALFVTFLWSTSVILIVVGLEDVPPLTFAGLRYGIASLLLAGQLARHRTVRNQIRRIGVQEYLGLVLLGVVFYAVTQGAQFVALQHVSAATQSLVLSFTPVLVILASIPLLHERQYPRQWFGTVISVIGAVIYFSPTGIQDANTAGLVAVFVGLVANAASSILGRAINRNEGLHPLAVTLVSMSVGATLLLIAGFATEPVPNLSLTSWAIVAWLASINTAFAFFLWNRSLQLLTATESSVINNTMLIQVAILAWLFLSQALTSIEIVGVAVVSVGTLLVQRRSRSTAGES